MLKEDALWGIYWQLIKSLLHLHGKNVIHRDLKPMNIFVTHNLHFKIGDFSESRRLKYGKVLKVNR
jgi:NIMA (never in mitosis gene a)-related kinase